MRSSICTIGVWTLLIATEAHGQDLQWWGEVDVTTTVRTVEVLALFVVRTNSTLPNPQLAGSGLTAEVRVRPHLTITGGYLFVDLPQRTQSRVHVPLVAATAMVRVRRLYLADRNRFEQLVGLPTSPVRYRNRVSADLPVTTNGRWHVFSDDEIFFDFSTSTWSQNRLQLGGGVRMRSGVVFDTFYLQRNLRGGLPTTRVFGTTLKIALKSTSGQGPR